MSSTPSRHDGPGNFSTVLRHRAGILLGLVVGAVYVSHHFFTPLFLENPDSGYYPITKGSYYDEATFYALRANASYHGEWRAGDISLSEYKGSPAILPVVNPLILGALGKIFGGMRNAFIVSDFLFPALIFFFLYLIFFEFTHRKTPSLIFATVFIFAPKLGMYFPPVTMLNARELLQNFLPFLGGGEPLHFSEFEEPKITFLFLSICIYLIIRALNGKNVRSAVWAGASFGFLFYTYFYDWVSVAVALAILAGMLLLRKDFFSLKNLWVIGAFGALVSLPYWFNFFSLRHLPQYGDIQSEVGIEIGRRFRFFSVWKSYLRIGVLTSAIFAIPRLRARSPTLFIVALLSSYLVTVNVQLVTGFNVQPDHWYRTLFLPVFLILALLALFFYDRFAPAHLKQLSRAGAVIFLTVFLSVYLVAEYRTSRVNADTFAVPKATVQSYDWLNKNTLPGSVVGAIAYDTNYEILLHTRNRVFLPVGLATVAPHEERWERFRALSRIYGLSSEAFREHASRGAYYLFAAKYTDHGFDRSFTRSALNYKISDKALDEETRRYESDVPNTLPQYRLDYLYVGPNERAFRSPSLEALPYVKKVYDAEGVEIYRLNIPIYE